MHVVEAQFLMVQEEAWLCIFYYNLAEHYAILQLIMLVAQMEVMWRYFLGRPVF